MKTPLLLPTLLMCAAFSTTALLSPTSAVAVPKASVPVTPAEPPPATPETPALDPNKRPAALPPEVRVMMARGGVTVGFVPLALGAPGTGNTVLLHCWMMERGTQMTDGGQPVPQLFCLDLFSREAKDKGPWQLAASTSYQSEGVPVTFQTRWLHPATRQGLVVVETSLLSSDVLYRLITFPNWTGDQSGESRTTQSDVKEFYASFGGPVSSTIRFGVDKSARTTIEEVIAPHAAVLPTRNLYAWNGTNWAVISSKKIQPGERVF